jgi:hypothetical protein
LVKNRAEFLSLKQFLQLKEVHLTIIKKMHMNDFIAPLRGDTQTP